MAGPFEGCLGSVYAALLWVNRGLCRGHLDGAPDWWVEVLRSLLAGIPDIEDRPEADETESVVAER